jgi:quercetin dioxygenase-like cupin family protein
MSKYKVDFDKIEWHCPTKGAKFKVYKLADRQLRLVEFRKKFIEHDWCTKGHIGYVLEGQLEVEFDGEIVTFSAGDGIFIPQGEKDKHKARVLSESVRLILVENA